MTVPAHTVGRMPYESARDLPTFLELDRQLKLLRLLGRSGR